MKIQSWFLHKGICVKKTTLSFDSASFNGELKTTFSQNRLLVLLSIFNKSQDPPGVVF